MKIELWKLSEMKPYPNNPRVNDDAVDSDSIREFGFRQPIVVDGDDVVICGHTAGWHFRWNGELYAMGKDSTK
jgi:ParB-like chromosome segregation protein Spo0J